MAMDTPSLPLDLISQLPHTHYHLSPSLSSVNSTPLSLCFGLRDGCWRAGGVVLVWLDDDGAGVGVQSHHIEYL